MPPLLDVTDLDQLILADAAASDLLLQCPACRSETIEPEDHFADSLDQAIVLPGESTCRAYCTMCWYVWDVVRTQLTFPEVEYELTFLVCHALRIAQPILCHALVGHADVWPAPIDGREIGGAVGQLWLSGASQELTEELLSIILAARRYCLTKAQAREFLRDPHSATTEMLIHLHNCKAPCQLMVEEVRPIAACPSHDMLRWYRRSMLNRDQNTLISRHIFEEPGCIFCRELSHLP